MSKVAVVTGASQGVGLEICRRLITLGWQVIGLARSEKRLAAAKNQLGDGFSFYTADISKAASVQNVFTTIAKQKGEVQLLINNAAVFKMKPLTEFSVAEVEQMIDTNLKGTIFTTMEALKLMRPGARIVNIASVSATHGIKNQAVYCASKYGVDGFSEALNQETIERGISLTTICPGGIDTPLWNAGNPYPGDKSRLLSPGDVAEAVAYVVQLPQRVVLKKMTLFPDNEWH